MKVAALLDKRANFKFEDTAAVMDTHLAEYVGRYSNQPWGSEIDVMSWDGGLAAIKLPTDDPAKAIEIYKPKGGGVFRRVRSDGSEAEEARFLRAQDGKVNRILRFNNYSIWVGDLHL